MSTAGAARVWDLGDSSHRRRPQRRGVDLAAPIAASLAAVALVASMLPDLGTVTRWSLVGSFGGVAALVAVSALRRRQTVLSLLLSLAALIAVGAACIVAATAPGSQHPVSNATVSDDSLLTPSTALVPSASFVGLPEEERTDATAFASSLVLRLRSLHGSYGPYPAQLQVSQGAVVESAGLLRGTSLGSLPQDGRLVYSVTRSGSAFTITVVSDTQPDATITASSALVVAGAS